MSAQKAVLNVRLSGADCDALRAIAARRATERNEPISLAAAVRAVVRDYIRVNGGGAGRLAEGQHGNCRTQ
jgi:hypothetical protein